MAALGESGKIASGEGGDEAMISTKGRYALRLMADIAENQGEGSVSLRDAAARQELSQKYLETICATLCRAGLIKSQRGANGGCRLARPAPEVSVAEVLRAAEGTISPVTCIETDGCRCERAEKCRTRPMWEKLDRMIEDYLSAVSIEDIIDGKL